MSIKSKTFICISLFAAAYFGRNYWLELYDDAKKLQATQNEKTAGETGDAFLAGIKTETEHYLISSTAKPQQTAQVAGTVESLHAAYAEFFKGYLPAGAKPEKMKLMLYRNREEFSAHNKSNSWAEAYYSASICHAYYSEQYPNPYHWMIHEATHQLNNEVAHFKTPKWINEGLASYFGTSRIENRRLLPGKIDMSAYPAWWLSDISLSGDIRKDMAEGRIIPLHQIIEGKGGPDINRHVNLYYIEYWSFSHFLFHYENGIYASSYKKLIAEGGSLESFERTIGPVDRIQDEWYGYLRQLRVDTQSPQDASSDDVVEISL